MPIISFLKRLKKRQQTRPDRVLRVGGLARGELAKVRKHTASLRLSNSFGKKAATAGWFKRAVRLSRNNPRVAEKLKTFLREKARLGELEGAERMAVVNETGSVQRVFYDVQAACEILDNATRRNQRALRRLG